MDVCFTEEKPKEKEKKIKGRNKNCSLTLNVEWVVDDKVPVPHHGEVNRQVADAAALIVILQTEKKKKKQTQRA